VQFRDGHISTCLIKTLVIYLCCAYCACASYNSLSLLVIYLFVLRYSLLSFIYFVYCSTFIFCFVVRFFFIDSLVRCSLQKEKKCHFDPELCSGISIRCTRSTRASTVGGLETETLCKIEYQNIKKQISFQQ
jgi:hypothetical protein